MIPSRSMSVSTSNVARKIISISITRESYHGSLPKNPAGNSLSRMASGYSSRVRRRRPRNARWSRPTCTRSYARLWKTRRTSWKPPAERPMTSFRSAFTSRPVIWKRAWPPCVTSAANTSTARFHQRPAWRSCGSRGPIIISKSRGRDHQRLNRTIDLWVPDSSLI